MKNTNIKDQDKMIDSLFEYAATCHVNNIISENFGRSEIDGDRSFTPEFEQKMKELIDDYKRKEQIKPLKKKLIRKVSIAAVILLISMISLSITAANVQAFRVKVLNVFIVIQDKFTSFQMRDNASNMGKNELVTNDQGQMTTVMKDSHIPEYVPKGFKIIDSQENPISVIIVYGDEKNETIRFTQYFDTKTDLRIDTEGGIIKNININGSKAMLINKDGRLSIVWKAESLYYIVGHIDESDLIKMAESIK